MRALRSKKEKCFGTPYTDRRADERGKNMEILTEGTRDAQGEWNPKELPKPGVLFRNPLEWREILKSFFGPQGSLIRTAKFLALTALVWYFLTPSLEQTTTLRVGWILLVYLRNVVLVTVIAGRLHWRLYVRKVQGMKYKYTPRWLATNDKKFMFGNQTWDNIFFSLVSGCGIWTAYEVLLLWGWANGVFPMLSLMNDGVLDVSNLILIVAVLLFVIPWYQQAHFYFTHRLIHWKPLYKISHYVHHRNINFGPWSGLSMHPIEHIIFFSDALTFLLIPVHPLVVMFMLIGRGIGPAGGHAGYHAFVRESSDGEEKPMRRLLYWGRGADFMHHLHHRYFTVNFGNLGFALDKLLNTFHDGSPEAHQTMLAHRKAKAKKSRRNKGLAATAEG
ncbi:MAG: desaturase [Spirochaetales bacterium]|nr:desaturase [Spirochaetales bacterium]